MAEKPHGLTGNKNAQKSDSTADAFVHFRVKKSDKSAWVNHAQGRGGLSEWAIKTLNEALKKQKKPE